MARNLATCLVAAACVYACLPDKDELSALRARRSARTSQSRHLKRDVVEYPPVLTDVETLLVNSFDNNSISDWSLYYTSGYRLAGHNRSQAEWTQKKWIDAGWESWIDEYWITYTEPIESTLSLKRPDGSVHDVQRRGSREDYQKLKDLGVELKGKIALAQYGGANRGVKIKNAEAHGMIDGPARHPSSIQRGSTRWGSLSFGDPSTIGYASLKDSPRADITPYGPSIPSIPISPRDGLQLLHALDNHGLSAETVNRTNYKGAFSNVTYHSGPAPGATLNLVNIMDTRLEPAWDVIASINGTNEDEYVIIGNHRDGWTAGGAADAVSGGALLIEMAKAFGKLVENGWKPRRTITEWVEDHLPELIEKTVAYINLDTAVSGPRAEIVGSGEIQTIAIETMKKIIFPEGYGAGPTLYDAWFNATEGVLPAMGSGSDYAAFYHNGITSLDIAGGPGPKDTVYAYHT
ncbi:hypothetical protein BFJ68_g2932 [Fusarium oxysporum]|uniref:Peptide hydrolase n=1 Tax=Fusarium oxysporum TaxID=5507 RepID=A0A420RT91_FUSOX|nr:hypothetical protein BFJ68_g2932 [Fusarium oxysporum]